jgi:hypothetical protein
MTIKELAEQVEKHTGKPMSRQNMTQRLGRDNFQEQDMRLIAKILGCKFQLSIMEMEEVSEVPVVDTVSEPEINVADDSSREITIGDLIGYEVEETAVETVAEPSAETAPEEEDEVKVKKEVDEREREILRKGISGYFKKSSSAPKKEAPVVEKDESVVGEINPYTGKEYKSNSVRMHPKRIGYVQVYDQEQHKWTEMTEWAFLGYQERKKVLLGKDYEPPIYLD